jgi:imidazolonepropionase-like amidohydrolase
MKRLAALALVLSSFVAAGVRGQDGRPVVLKPARVFDGVALKTHDDWIVVVRGQRILAAGPRERVNVPDNARTIDLAGATLLPGLIEAHSHVFLHP